MTEIFQKNLLLARDAHSTRTWAQATRLLTASCPMRYSQRAVRAKQNGVVAGLDIAKTVFLLLDDHVSFRAYQRGRL